MVGRDTSNGNLVKNALQPSLSARQRLIAFYVACGIGSLINLALAEWLYLKSFAYWAAGLVGALVAALWNFFTTASWTWGRARQAVR